jgi:hypothetical protein
MEIFQTLFLLVLCAAICFCAIAICVSMIYRNRMAPLVREAMNAAYDEVEFLRINHIPERCDGETLSRFECACAILRDANNSLSSGRYKLTVELANQASAMARSLRGRMVCREHSKPIFPSNRLSSYPDHLVWMGK